MILKGWLKRFCRTLSALFSPPGMLHIFVQHGGHGLQETGVCNTGRMEKCGEATGMELILEIVGGETGSSLMNADNVCGCEDETGRVDGFLELLIYAWKR